jgi:branched-chain amino acid transport system permease protein
MTSGRLRWALGLYAALAAIVIAATYLGSLGSTTIDRAVVNALIALILVLGLSTFVGASGVFSFGHMAFMAIGAYITAILTMSPQQKRLQLPDLPGPIGSWHVNPLLAVLIGALGAALFAAVVAIPLMRLSGLTASLATVALLITMRVIFQNWETYTRGTRGLILDSKSPSREVVLVAALLLLAVAVAFRFSAVGRRLGASREDEASARSLGIRVWWERGLAWVLSAFMVGIAGGLFALYFRNISPDSFYIAITFTVLAMLVIGGLKSVSGAVIGTVVVTGVLELLRQIERGWTIAGVKLPSRLGMSELGLAVVLLVILIVRPDGLVPHELRWPRGRASRASPPDATAPRAVDDELTTIAAADPRETAPELRRAP